MATKNLPARAKSNLPVNWQEQMKADAQKGKKQAEHIGVGQFMSTRGGVLQFMGTPVPGNKMNAVILASCLENAFYPGEFDPDNPTPPACYAFGDDDESLKPHDAVKKPEADACADCEKNKFGSAETGRGKACKNGVRMGLMHADELKKDIDGAQIAFLKIPPTSLPSWKAYQDQLDQLGGNTPCYGVVTEISIQPDPKAQFKVLFNVVRKIDNKVMPGVFQKAKKTEGNLVQPYQEIDTSALKKGAKKPARNGTQQAGGRRRV